MIPSCPEAQHAQDMPESMPGGRAEVHGYQASARFENAADFREPALLQVIRQMVEHQAAQYHVEERVRVRERLDRRDLEPNLNAGPGRIPPSQADHLGRWVDAERLARSSSDASGNDRESSWATPHVQDPLTRGDGGEPHQLATQGRHPSEGKDRCPKVVELSPPDGLSLGMRKCARATIFGRHVESPLLRRIIDGNTRAPRPLRRGPLSALLLSASQVRMLIERIDRGGPGRLRLS